MCERGMYVEVKYFMFESFVPDFVKSFGDIVLLCVGYRFMEYGKGSVRPSKSPKSVMVVVVEVV